MSKNVFNLIKYLKVDANDFYSVLRMPDSKKYYEFTLKKKNGKNRLIEAPCDDKLIHIQNRIRLFLENKYEEHPSKHAFGYRKGKCIVDNAEEHFIQNQRRFIVKVDLQDFFNTISIERVIQLINKGLGVSVESSNAIALMVTRHRHLPQGACTSPIISNMVCKKMDRELSNYAHSVRAVYTRYADDIFFSFSTKDNALQILDQNQFPKIDVCDSFKDIIHRNGFEINKGKTRLLAHNNSQRLCGIVINEKINVKRSILRDIRTKLYKLENGDNSINLRSLIGKISYARFVREKNDELVNKYCERINNVTIPPFPDADFRINSEKAFNKYLVRIENASENIDELSNSYGTGFFANGFLVTSKHVVEYDTVDPFGGEKGFFKKLNISYYDKNGAFLSKIINVTNVYLHSEIAFLEIDCFEDFKTKSLKITKPVLDRPRNAYCCGCQINDYTGLGVFYDKKRVIGQGSYYGHNAYSLEYGSIVKGMSGGPLIDCDTYKVIGVNFSGNESVSSGAVNSVSSMLDTEMFKSKKKWTPNPNWLLKHKEWM